MMAASTEDIDLDEVYAFAVQLGKDAGAMLMSAAQARFAGGGGGGFEEKESAVDIVTKTDEGMPPHTVLFSYRGCFCAVLCH